MNHLKKLVAIIICITVLSTMCLLGSAVTVLASGTGAGLAEWAMNAYYSGWAYVYGGSTPGAVDCSGLIYGIGHAVYSISDPRATILKEYAQKLQNIDESITQTIVNEAKDKGYSLVLTKTVAIYGGDDITEEVMKVIE